MESTEECDEKSDNDSEGEVIFSGSTILSVSTFENNYKLKPAMVVLLWDSVQCFVDVHQDWSGWCRLMIWQNVDPVGLGLVSLEEADAIKHGRMFTGTQRRKELESSTERTPDQEMEEGMGISAVNASEFEAEIESNIEESEVWKDLVGNRMRFTSFPSVVTWNYGMRKQD
eukprot:2112021-Rhodomonas_salina.1